MYSWQRRSSSSVATPACTCGVIMSSTCAAKRPATRILSCSSGVLIVIIVEIVLARRSTAETGGAVLAWAIRAVGADSRCLPQGAYGIKRAPRRQTATGVNTHTRLILRAGCPGNGVVRRNAWRTNPKGAFHGRRHHAPDAGSGRALRAPNPFLESQNGRVHLRRAQQDPHHQSRADDASLQGGGRVRAQARRRRRDVAVRRIEAGGARGDCD